MTDTFVSLSSLNKNPVIQQLYNIMIQIYRSIQYFSTARLSAQALYTTARNIYKAFSQKLISVEQAKREKAQALRDYDAWERGEAIAHDYFRRTVALQQVYTNAVKGECENCKKMFGIMTGLIPPQNGGNT